MFVINWNATMHFDLQYGFTISCNGEAERNAFQNHLDPLLLTWFNFNPSMDK